MFAGILRSRGLASLLTTNGVKTNKHNTTSPVKDWPQLNHTQAVLNHINIKIRRNCMSILIKYMGQTDRGHQTTDLCILLSMRPA